MVLEITFGKDNEEKPYYVNFNPEVNFSTTYHETEVRTRQLRGEDPFHLGILTSALLRKVKKDGCPSVRQDKSASWDEFYEFSNSGMQHITNPALNFDIS